MKDNNFNFNQVFLNTLDSLTSYKFSIGKGYASEQLLSFLHLNNISANISEKSLSLLLAKGSFAFLLISMLSYWFQMSFKSQIVMDKEILNPLQIEDLSGTECVGSPVSTDIDCKAKIHSYNSTYSTKKAINCSTTSSGTLEGKPPHAALNLDLSGYASETDRKNNLTYLLTKLIDGSASAIIFKKVPLISMWSANITLALLLSIRWIESGHFPLSNLYESLIFLSWSLTVIHLFLENLFNKNSLKKQILCSLTSAAPEGKPPHAALNLELSKSASSGANPTLTLGAITSPVALFTNAFATFSLPQEMQKVTVLVPALKSNWLIMHVSVMIISYAALLSGSLLAMAFLVIKFIDELRSNNVNDNKVPSILSTFIHSVRKLSTLTQLIDRGFVSDAYPSGIPKGVKPRNKKQFFPRKPLRGTAVPQKGTAGMRERGNANSLPQFVNTITSLTQLLRNSLFLPNSSASYSSSSISSASCAKQSVGLAQLETFQHIPQRGNTSTGVKAQYLPDELVASEICNNWQSKDKFPATQTHIAQREKACVARNQQSSSVTVRSKAPYKSEICMGSTSAQRLVRRAGAYPSGVPQGAFLGTVAELPLTTKNKMLMDLPQILDNLSYRSIGLGFALLTIGILSGAVWANEAWGSYWSWDPKETWAFITWLVFALYLHTRLSKGWVGKESAFVASFGFIVIWFCYLGVNLFGKGLHSYGWFQQ